MEVNEESEPSPVFQAEKETQLYIDPKRAKVPKDWIWINTGEEGFYCANMVVTGGRMLNPKSIQMFNNNVTYLVKQKFAKPLHLACSFKSIEELNDIFKYFDAADICECCPEEDLQLLQLDSTNKAGDIKKKHCWRSNSCEYVVVPGEKRCSSCVCLMKILKKKKTKATKVGKLKKTQVELKNLRKKNQRSTTKIMVQILLFYFDIFIIKHSNYFLAGNESRN